VKHPVKLAEVAGANVTVTEREAPAASVNPAVEDSENVGAEPAQSARPFTVRVEVPRFWTVTFCVAVPPTRTSPNVTTDGLALIVAGMLYAVPPHDLLPWHEGEHDRAVAFHPMLERRSTTPFTWVALVAEAVPAWQSVQARLLWLLTEVCAPVLGRPVVLPWHVPQASCVPFTVVHAGAWFVPLPSEVPWQ
jgi:hypothetical protein